MNWLAHAYLSFDDDEVLCGNMIGDFVKGQHAIALFPEGIAKGIRLHRAIDDFADNHPELKVAKDVFRPVYGLYSGSFTDVMLDHFLAQDKSVFSDRQALNDFAGNVYVRLEQNAEHFPERFIPFYESMRRHNWLAGYGSQEGLLASLNGLQRRAKHISEVQSAFDLINEHRSLLHAVYENFFPQINDFARNF